MVLIIVSSMSVIAQDAKYSFKESYQLSAPSTVSVSSSDGNIEVVTIEGKNTDVFYVVKKDNRILNISKAEVEKEIELEVVQEGSSLSIVVKYKNEFRMLDWRDKMVIDFRLQVPSSTSCDLRTSDGNVSVSGMKKDQKLRTSDGNVNISNIGGSVVASTSDGNVNVDNVNGVVDVKTSDGDITATEIKGDTFAGTSDGNITITKITGKISAKTSDGDIRFKDLSGSITASTSDGNVSGNLLKLTNELNVKTSDGNITVSIPGNLGLDLDIKGESLDVPLTNFSGRSDENRIVGKCNGGGVAVNISTSGNVRLNYN